ncbi:MAG: S-layer homology domain-containing protein [Thermaerobacter sp.]|nr:S-layer homology domain-containing protein [Thermaerobacter sp.]
MIRWRGRTGRTLLALVAAGALLQLAVGAAMAQTYQPSPESGAVPLAGNRLPAVAAGTVPSTGQAPDLNQSVTLVIGLRLPNPSGLQAAAAAVHAGGAPPLTPAQFVAQYAPSATDYHLVVGWLQNQGFEVQTPSNRLIVVAQGTLGQAASAFGVTFRNYSVGGNTYFANVTKPQVPSDLAGIIQSIAGLDNFPAFHTGLQPVQLPAGRAVSNSVYDGADGFTPLGIEKAYNVLPVYGSVYGTGQTVDIVIWNAINQSDVNSFDATYGLPSFTPDQIGVGGTPSVDFNGGSGEATLDVEMVHSLAPGAAVNVYEAVNNSSAYLEEAVNEAVVQHAANVLSMSWGATDANLPQAYRSTMDALFAQGAAEGMTLLASSGDNGAYGSGGTTVTPQFPASDPYVTGVGATVLNPTADGAYGGETVWNCQEGLGYCGANTPPPYYYGSGGGFSPHFQAPAWQTPAETTYNNVYSIGSNLGFRGVPDVALNGGAGTAAYVNGSLGGYIGTSVAAPSWAGLVALVDQALGNAGKPPLGYFNPTLYQLGQSSSYTTVFHQVYIGDNDTMASGGVGPYYASDGWNPVTGWGTPDFQALLSYLTNLAPSYPPSITASPTALAPNYAAQTITISGVNTHFGAGTTVSLKYNGNEYVSNVQVQSPTRLTFTMVSGLPDGQGNISVTDSTDGTLTASLDVGAEAGSVSPTSVTAGYSPTTIDITGVNSAFASGAVTAQVVYAANQETAIDLDPPNPAVEATVTSYTAASFTLPAGLAPGEYDVVVNDITGGVSMSIPLTVMAASPSLTVAPATLPYNYTGPVAMAVYGSNTNWSAYPPTMTLSYNGQSEPGWWSNPTVVSNGYFTFDLNAGLPSGSYQVQLTDPVDGTLTGYFQVQSAPCTGCGGAGGSGGAPASSPTSTSPTNTSTSASVSVTTAGGTVAMADNSVVLNVPAGAFSATVTVNVDAIPTAQAYTVAAGMVGASPQWSISTANGAEPSQPVPATFQYNPSALGGLSPLRLGVYGYNPATNTWTWVGGKVDTSNDTISANLPHFSIYGVLANTATFSDLSQAPWARSAVDTLLGAHLVAGVAPGVFDPNGTLTRAQFATLLVKAEGLAPVASGTSPFTDVSPSAWYAPYVAAAYNAGLVAGVSSTTFDPNGSITREQMAVMLAKLLGSSAPTGSLSQFSDAASIASYAQSGVEAAVGAGLMAGFPNGTFQPTGLTTRAQAAAVLAKYLGYIGKV